MRAAGRDVDRQVAAGFLSPDERSWARDQMLIIWKRADTLGLLWPRSDE